MQRAPAFVVGLLQAKVAEDGGRASKLRAKAEADERRWGRQGATKQQHVVSLQRGIPNGDE